MTYTEKFVIIAEALDKLGYDLDKVNVDQVLTILRTIKDTVGNDIQAEG